MKPDYPPRLLINIAKQHREQIRRLDREVKELRERIDCKRWPELVKELREAERDARAAKEALAKMREQRDLALQQLAGIASAASS